MCVQVMCPPAWNCNVNSASAELYVISASTELCALCGFHKRGIVCFVWFPQAWNCVLCVVSASANCVVSASANCVVSASAESCA